MFNLLFVLPSNHDQVSAVLPHTGVVWEDFIGLLECLLWIMAFSAASASGEAPHNSDMRTYLRTFPLFYVLENLVATLSGSNHSRQMEHFWSSWHSSSIHSNKWAYHILASIDTVLNFHYSPIPFDHFLVGKEASHQGSSSIDALIKTALPEASSRSRGPAGFGRRMFQDTMTPNTIIDSICWWGQELISTIQRGTADQFSPVPTQLVGAPPEAAPLTACG